MPDDGPRWLVWSEEHGAWWGPLGIGYTRSIVEAERYSEKLAREIEAKANRYPPEGELHEVAMPDPLSAGGSAASGYW